MRLIDADKFIEEEPLLWDWKTVDGISSSVVLKQCIWDVACEPTVEAIPLDFIKSFSEKLIDRKERWLLDTLVEVWERENEHKESD